MAGNTLDERAKIFQAQYPDKKLDRYRLRRLYFESGIKRKVVR